MIPAWKARFVEQVGLLFDSTLPRSVARVLGWLVVCEPDHQSADDLRAVLQLSSGAVSTAVSSLVSADVVDRVTFPGDRRTFYRLGDDGWERLIRLRVQTFADARAVADEAIASGGRLADERLASMREFFGALEERFADLFRN